MLAALAAFGEENAAPLVSAGLDRSIVLGSALTLIGSAVDDGMPTLPGNLALQWTKISGPGSVSFGSPASLQTGVSFSEPGTYTLRLTANDGELVSFDELTVNVAPDVMPAPITSTTVKTRWGSARG
jgi:hypothetical protein